jgi:hypothetical protein
MELFLKIFILSLFIGLNYVFASPSCVFFEFDEFGSYKTQYEVFFRTQMRLSLRKLQLQVSNKVKTSGTLTAPQQNLMFSIEKDFTERHLKHEAYQTHMQNTHVAKFLLARERLANIEPDSKLHQNVILGVSPLIQVQKQEVNLSELFHLTNTDIKAISYAQAIPEFQTPISRLLELANSNDPSKIFEAIKELETNMDLLDNSIKADLMCSQNEQGKCEQLPLVSDLYIQANQDIIAKLIPTLQKNNQLASVDETIDKENAHTFLRSFGSFADFNCNRNQHMMALIGDCEIQKKNYEKNKISYENGEFLNGYIKGLEELERVVPLFKSKCSLWNQGASQNNRSSPYININSRCDTDQTRSHTVLDLECVQLNNGADKIFQNYKDSFINRVRECRQAGGSFHGGDGVINE